MPTNRKPDETLEEYRERCRLYHIEYREKNREKFRKYNREYNKKWREENGYHNEYNSKKRYPERALARRLLQYAVKAGKIKRQPCKVCGKKNTHGHHDDYYKPLEVKWFCALHHTEYHKKQLCG